MPRRITIGQIVDVMQAAQALGTLEIGSIQDLRVKIMQLSNAELAVIIHQITSLRRVAREWQNTPVQSPEES